MPQGPVIQRGLGLLGWLGKVGVLCGKLKAVLEGGTAVWAVLRDAVLAPNPST